MSRAAEIAATVALPPESLDELAQRIAAALAPIDRQGSPWMTVEEAAEYLRWKKDRLYKLTAAGTIPHRKHQGRLLFHRDELDAWLDGYREGPLDALVAGRRLRAADGGRMLDTTTANGRAARERPRPGTRR